MITRRSTIRKANRIYEVVRSIVEYEIYPANTVSFFNQVDLTAAERLRGARKAAGLPHPSYTALVVKAAALTLKAFPQANGRVLDRSFNPFAGTRLQQFSHCDIAVQAEMNLPDTEVATFADVLRDADQVSFEAMGRWLRELANPEESGNRQWAEFHRLVTWAPRWLARWALRAPLFSPALWERYRGGALLVNSPARHGVDMLASAWTWPITVSFGLVKERPMVVDGEVVARRCFTLIMNFDRRLMAGAQAARFFKHLTDLIERADETLADHFERPTPSS